MLTQKLRNPVRKSSSPAVIIIMKTKQLTDNSIG